MTDGFTSLDERGELRARLFRTRTQNLLTQYGSTPEEQDAVVFRGQTRLLRAKYDAQAASDVADLRAAQAGALREAEAGLGQLRGRVGALDLVEQEEQSRQLATQASQRQSVGGLNALLDVLDQPRKWTYENFVLPTAHRIGLNTDDIQTPTGREFFNKALGGDKFSKWADENKVPWAGDAASIAAGFLLDINFDPLNYITFGAGLGASAGGRALSTTGRALLSGTRGAVAATKNVDALLDASGALRTLQGGLRAEAATAASRTAKAQLLNDARFARQMSKETVAVAGGLQPNLKVPDADRMFSLLRATGASSEVFKPGGFQLALPFNSFSMRVPLLNAEDALGLTLGGYEVAPGTLRKFDDIRRTAVDLGHAALARVPTGIKGVAGAATAAGVAAGLGFDNLVAGAGLAGATLATPQGRAALKHIFVPYASLQGWGRESLREGLKWISNLSRTEHEDAGRIVGQLFAGATPEQTQKVQYYLDIGPVWRTKKGARTETFDDFAKRMNNTSGGANIATAQDVEDRIADQIIALQHKSELAAQLGFRPQIKVRDALDKLRGRKPGDTAATAPTEMAAADLIQWQIERSYEALNTGKIERRLTAKELVGDPRRFKALEPDDRVREMLEQIIKVETDAFGMPSPMGPVGAITKYAIDHGLQGMLPQYLRHIHDTDISAAAKRMRAGPPQLGQRSPANIGKQRVTSFLAEPEVLDALGFSTNPEVILGKTLAQYKTMARESQFVNLVLENFGKRAGSLPPSGINADEWEVFDPTEWFTKRTPNSKEFKEQLEFFRAETLMDEDEAKSLLMNLFDRQVGQSAKHHQQAWYLPKDVKRALQMNREVVDSAGGWFAAADAVLNVQRALVTVTWPAYHTRNLVGNLYNSHLGGVSAWDHRSLSTAAEVLEGRDGDLPKWVVDALKGLSDKTPLKGVGDQYNLSPQAGDVLTRLASAGGQNPLIPASLPGAGAELAARTGQDVQQYTVAWFRKYLEERGVLRTGQTAVDATVVPGGGAVEKGASKLLEWYPFKKGRTIAEATDNIMRVRHVLGRMALGDDLEEAVLSTKKFLFDYSDLTEVEKNLFRRGAFFYTWLRKNIPLQLEMLATKPNDIAVWKNVFNNFNDAEAQKNADAALLPAWVREQLGLIVGEDENGKVRVLSGLGLPFEDLNTFNAQAPEGLIRRFLGLSNPLVQYVMNAAGMPSSFTDRAVDDDLMQNYYRTLAPWYAEAVKLVPGLSGVLDLQERQVLDQNGRERSVYSANPWALYALYNVLSLGRFMRVGSNLNKLAENPTQPRATAFALRTLTGINVSETDLSRPLEAISVSPESLKIDSRAAQDLEAAARDLQAGKIAPEQWRGRRNDAMSSRSNQRDLLRDQQIEAQLAGRRPLSETESQAIEDYRTRFKGNDQQLLDLIMTLNPNGTNPVSGEPFFDAREFAKTREFLIEKLPAEARGRFDQIKDKWVSQLPPAAQAAEREYQKAVSLLDEYEKVPKYRGLSEDEAQIVDQLYDLQRGYSREVGPAMAKAIISREYPKYAGLLARAGKLRNTKDRQRKWRQLNDANNHILTKHFANIPASELAILD